MRSPMTTTADAFRQLRTAWFNKVLKSYTSEREWENNEDQLERLNRNLDLKTLYDQQTEQIIDGKQRCVAPKCANDVTVVAPEDEYRELFKRLLTLINQGNGDSPEADQLRDKMDRPFRKMTAEQRRLFEQELMTT